MSALTESHQSISAAKKRPRRTRAELRDLMLLGGKEILLDSELAVGFEELTYSAVFEHLRLHHDQKVTIGSVHERIWASQRDYQLNVVTHLLQDAVDDSPNQSFVKAATTLHNSDLSTPKARRYALQTATRLSSRHVDVEQHERAIDILHTVRFRLFTLADEHPDSDGLTAAIKVIRQASTSAYGNVVRGLMKVVGVRVRADAGDPDEVIESMALLTNAVSIGLKTDVLPQAISPRTLPTGPDGEDEQWYPDAIALWAYTRAMFELDGDDLTEAERRL